MLCPICCLFAVIGYLFGVLVSVLFAIDKIIRHNPKIYQTNDDKFSLLNELDTSYVTRSIKRYILEKHNNFDIINNNLDDSLKLMTFDIIMIICFGQSINISFNNNNEILSLLTNGFGMNNINNKSL
eukprot:428209_1